jgi:hypothetical protein
MDLATKIEPVAMSSSDIKSNIIKQAEQLNLIQKWLGASGKRVTYKLLYKGTRDKFLSQTFHEKVDSHEHTLILAKNAQKNTYGGYADQTWNITGGYKPSQNSFIFDMSKKKKYPVNSNQIPNALFPHVNAGPSFGYTEFVCLQNNQQNIIFNPRQCYGENQNQAFGFGGSKGGQPYEVLEELEVFKISYEGIPKVDSGFNQNQFGYNNQFPGGFSNSNTQAFSQGGMFSQGQQLFSKAPAPKATVTSVKKEDSDDE